MRGVCDRFVRTIGRLRVEVSARLLLIRVAAKNPVPATEGEDGSSTPRMFSKSARQCVRASNTTPGRLSRPSGRVSPAITLAQFQVACRSRPASTRCGRWRPRRSVESELRRCALSSANERWRSGPILLSRQALGLRHDRVEAVPISGLGVLSEDTRAAMLPACAGGRHVGRLLSG